jgi:hypothetical protein
MLEEDEFQKTLRIPESAIWREPEPFQPSSYMLFFLLFSVPQTDSLQEIFRPKSHTLTLASTYNKTVIFSSLFYQLQGKSILTATEISGSPL